MPKYTIGELCHVEKGNTPIQKAESGEYPLVVTAEKRLSNNDYQFNAKAVCIPLVSSTGHGHASIKRIHYQEGKFALGSILAAVIPKEENFLNAEYLYVYLSYMKDSILVPLMKGSANVSLTIKSLCTAIIDVPNIEVQKRIIDQSKVCDERSFQLKELANYQLSDIDSLRNSILQNAIRGKLVQQDYNDEPAKVLLQKIAEEKERLILEKKIKKENTLPPLMVGEIPYELPEGWEWVRLTDIGELSRGKSKHRPRNDEILFKNGQYPFIQTGDVARSKGLILKCDSFYNEVGLKQSRLWKKGTLCITIAANIADTGILGIDACFPDSIVGFIPFKPINSARYVEYFFKVAKGDLVKFAPSTAQKNINLSILYDLIVPLPPLNEQRRIVEKVDKLMVLCNELENYTKQTKADVELLMQSILQEAFKK